jgi:hypothetical protein
LRPLTGAFPDRVLTFALETLASWQLPRWFISNTGGRLPNEDPVSARPSRGPPSTRVRRPFRNRDGGHSTKHDRMCRCAVLEMLALPINAAGVLPGRQQISLQSLARGCQTRCNGRASDVHPAEDRLRRGQRTAAVHTPSAGTNPTAAKASVSSDVLHGALQRLVDSRSAQESDCQVRRSGKHDEAKADIYQVTAAQASYCYV